MIVPPKIYESFSYTVAQALACGKPVILSNSGGMPQTVNYGEYGRIFDKESVVSLKAEMIAQINDKSDNSEDIRNYAIKRFGLQNNKKEYISFYNRVKGL